MSLHKLTAGSGYDYLTRQVAAFDSTEKGHTGLASYYTEKGETPGVWVGFGVAGVNGLATGDIVTAEQMQSLFGSGHHPLAAARAREFDQRIGRPGMASPTRAEYRAATRLGAPYKVYKNDVSAFRVEVAKRMAAFNEAAGLPGDWPVPAAERARIRTDVGREFFTVEHGREPADARELAATIARHSRPRTKAVAGYDLTFSPVKSVSVLWALADQATAATIERAHRAAINDALAFIENKALFTREGTNGARQVDTRGLVATAFTHRDSRAGDPDLHSHIAVANKVQTRAGGKWLAIDGRLMFKAKVSASETYNTALERHLSDALGLRFQERPNTDTRKRPVREIVGIDGDLNARFSKRRHSVEARRKELAADFQRSHGRPPTPVETLNLAQQATLETRDAKHEPRTLAQQRESWHTEALEVLGGPQRLRQMLRSALQPRAPSAAPANAAWVTNAADRIIATMEGSRATWQYWHVYAEAQRQARTAQVPTDQLPQLVGLLVQEVLEDRSVRITQPLDDITEPAQLRRIDGSSVYVVGGVHLFTSATVLAAEQRLVATAGRYGGFATPAPCVELALLESTANGVTLNAGQATLVRRMATSGARLQLAIAPAGSGKTTAMRALASAWTDGGGKVIGLAPSAAAADALRMSMGPRTGTRSGTQTDTLAKLTHSLRTGNLPDWVAGIDASTLVVIDEAGMADTISLDVVVRFVLERGGSVRLVGDDQQLAAIGAGGVLRDIRAQHGALQLSELVRFRDPAEGAASLALREGHTDSLGFYLDRQRVHVGDLATMTADVLGAWQADRAAGLDSVMLAPTRDLVSELNQQARAHRLDSVEPGALSAVGRTRRLADGNEASVGELLITRENDRRLRTSATDWVKNGDRWSVLAVHDDGALTVQHLRHGRTVRLPAEYVERSTELGYACTVHTAQGVTADTMHGLAAGAESRQQLYTMLTRGAQANHVYLEVVGDGDPHSVIHPTLIRPLTGTDILESMLARDDAPQSATSMIRDQADPRTRLGHAAQRYLDSLYFAAEDAIGSTAATAMDAAIEELLSGLNDEPAWPSLRAHLMLLGANGVDPVAALGEAASDRSLDTAADRAAVLDWRLDPTGMRNVVAGPLPWMPEVPTTLAEHPQWGSYLRQRSDLVAELAGQVHQDATTSAQAGSLPGWDQRGVRPAAETIGDVEVWRAATGVETTDRRPTGAPQAQKAPALWQLRLNRQLTGDHTSAFKEWSHLLLEISPQIRTDAFTPLLAERLAAMSRAGLAAHQLLRRAAAAGHLPDDHAAAALWWRMSRHLTPAVAAQISDGSHSEAIIGTWGAQLATLLGPDRTARLKASAWWPALVSNIDHALQRGWQLEDLLMARSGVSVDSDRTGPGVDECLALVWRTSIALDPIPDEHDHYDPSQEPPEDLWEGVEPRNLAPVDHTWTPDPEASPRINDVDRMDAQKTQTDRFDPAIVERDLLLAQLRRHIGAVDLEPTEAQLLGAYRRAREWDDCPVARERLIEVNTLARQFFESHLPGSWARRYLAERFGDGLASPTHIRAGLAPAGWTNLVDHLGRHGVSEEEMLAAGVATRARTGRLIDRFRDRVMFPIEHHGDVLGFVGRHRPELGEDDNAGPRYLNTATTALFHKGDQLFVTDPLLLSQGATPVLVEGPMDAYAVTLAGEGRYVGVASLGTSLTEQQAGQLARTNRDPIVATDPDVAGQVAAERNFWLLTAHGLDPTYARFPGELDPADVLAQRGPHALVATLNSAAPLGQVLLDERVTHMAPADALLEAVQVLAARRPGAWGDGVRKLGEHLYVGDEVAARFLRDAVETWDADPRTVAADKARGAGLVRTRLEAAAKLPLAQRWTALANELDTRLVHEPDWPATANMLQRAHEAGHDIRATTRAMVTQAPLGESPARDLRYRIVRNRDVTVEVDESRSPMPGSAMPRNKDATPDQHYPRATSEHPRNDVDR